MHSGGRKVILLTEQTMLHYVDIPNEVAAKYKAGIITRAHFSDMVRMQLLYRYGGLWVDATIMAVKDFSGEIFSCPLYTIKKAFASPYTDYRGKPSASCSAFRWTVYFMATLKGAAAPYIISAVLFAYWKENDKPIDYFLTDEAIKFCHEHSGIVHNAIDSVPLNNPDVNLFSWMEEDDEGDVRRKVMAALKDTNIFKLSYKTKYTPAVQKVLNEMLPSI